MCCDHTYASAAWHITAGHAPHPLAPFLLYRRLAVCVCLRRTDAGPRAGAGAGLPPHAHSWEGGAAAAGWVKDGSCCCGSSLPRHHRCTPAGEARGCCLQCLPMNSLAQLQQSSRPLSTWHSVRLTWRPTRPLPQGTAPPRSAYSMRCASSRGACGPPCTCCASSRCAPVLVGVAVLALRRQGSGPRSALAATHPAAHGRIEWHLPFTLHSLVLRGGHEQPGPSRSHRRITAPILLVGAESAARQPAAASERVCGGGPARHAGKQCANEVLQCSALRLCHLPMLVLYSSYWRATLAGCA